MGQKFLLDSNAVIDYTSKLLPYSAIAAMDTIINDEFNISIIVMIEVLGFNGTQAKINQLQSLFQLAVVIPVNEEIAREAIELRRNYKKIQLGDAIIAATAMVFNVFNYTLITRNIMDFKKIEELKLVNPYEM